MKADYHTYSNRKLGINVGLLLISIYPTWVVISNLDPPEDEDLKKRPEGEEDDSITQKENLKDV